MNIMAACGSSVALWRSKIQGGWLPLCVPGTVQYRGYDNVPTVIKGLDLYSINTGRGEAFKVRACLDYSNIIAVICRGQQRRLISMIISGTARDIHCP
jgi:hypothetical protein